jgi:hypothetical protein
MYRVLPSRLQQQTRRAQFAPEVTLTVTFSVAGLTPREVRRRFIDALRIAIARTRVTREIEPAICEELWRALPSTRGQRT